MVRIRTRAVPPPGDLARGRDPVQIRHPDVHEHDVWLEPRDAVDGLAARGGLADDLELPVAFECVSQPFTDQVVIVD